MTTAFRLIAKAITFQVPPRILLFGLLNKINFLLRTGNRRYEFERLYLEEFDPWQYHTSAYERQKYERTLATILAMRRGGRTALEVGCSLGVFSGMLAPHFDRLVSVDISREAIRQAKAHNRAHRNLTFVRSDILGFDQGVSADVIVCAEVLYYLREADAEAVCDQLQRNLAQDGILVYVSGVPSGEPNPYYFSGWEEILSRRFQQLRKERVEDAAHDYEIMTFGRR